MKKVKETVLNLGTKFTRIQITEISEKCGITDEQIIIETVKEMIKNKEIFAEYFSSSKSVAFDQQTNIDEIDKLMDAYKELEGKKFKKEQDIIRNKDFILFLKKLNTLKIMEKKF